MNMVGLAMVSVFRAASSASRGQGKSFCDRIHHCRLRQCDSVTRLFPAEAIEADFGFVLSSSSALRQRASHTGKNTITGHVMVKLNKIYTRTGDDGETSLGSGERVSKADLRIEAYGTVDEANAVLGLVRLHTGELTNLDAMLGRIQNELFDLGADLCVPERGKKPEHEPLRIAPTQYERIEREIDELNGELQPLRSFVLPGGHPAAACLHQARTVVRRAERLIVALKHTEGEHVSEGAVAYINRLSDFFFVASRWVNAKAGTGDILWEPGKTR
jgi:cob(I)alamin adenosyltransferase